MSRRSPERRQEPPKKARARTRRCPICGKPQDDKFKPFCSKRCADVDLSRWLKGAYAIAAEEEPRENRGTAEEDDAE